jgi:hypothetical protein
MNDRPDASEIQQLLDKPDLNEADKIRLTEYAEAEWGDILAALRSRSRNAYAVAEPNDFATCITQHMSTVEQIEMTRADVYHCPKCGRHIKDRRTPVASSVLVERRRLRQLYLAIEEAAAGEARDEATRRFIAALGVQ